MALLCLFGTFTVALFKKWWPLMSCAVFTALGVYLEVTHRSNQWIIAANVVLAICFLVLASFLVWKDEHARLCEERTKNEKPKLIADVLQLVLNAEHGEKFGWTLFAKISILNPTTSPCSVPSVHVETPVEEGRFWAVDFKRASILRHVEDKRTAPYLPAGVISVTNPVKEIVTSCLQLLKDKALDRGVPREGWLAFTGVPYVSRDQTFNFFVRDGYGESHGPFTNKGELERGVIRKLNEDRHEDEPFE
jgi:hypothetical protein